MAYCPRCNAEYADQVRECVDCHIPTRPGHRPIRMGPDAEDLLVPIGSAFCLLFAALMLVLAMLARQGELGEPYGSIVLATQPTCLTAFYVLVVVVSTATFLYWLLRRVSERRR